MPPKMNIKENYCTQLIKHWNHIYLKGMGSELSEISHIPLEKVFVKLNLEIEQRRVSPPELGYPGEDERARESGAREDYREYEARKQREERKAETITLSVAEALQHSSHLTILGSPGAGKTTLTKWLAVNFAQKLLQPTEPTTEFLSQPLLPILLPLRSFGDSFRNDVGTKDLGEKIAHYISEDALYGFGGQKAKAETFILAALNEGNCLILLDGLDEIAESEVRDKLLSSVYAFFLHPDADRKNNQCILTSRPYGYKNTGLEPIFQACEVKPFSPEDVKEFIEHWYDTTYGRSFSNEAARLIEAIEGNDRVAALATNPLLCTNIAIVYRNKQVLPNRRVELYKSCCEVLLATWKPETHPGAISKDTFETKLGWLAPLAYWLHGEQGRLASPEGKFVQQLATIWQDQKRFVNQEMAEQEARQFIAAIRDRSGLLQGRGDGTLEFMHRTFQEYLAAYYIASRRGEGYREEYIDLVMPHLHEAWWQEVHLLVIGILGSSGEMTDDVAVLLRTILYLYKPPRAWLRPWLPKNRLFHRLRLRAAGWFSFLYRERRLAWALQREFELVVNGFLDCEAQRQAAIAPELKRYATDMWRRYFQDDASIAFDHSLLIELNRQVPNSALLHLLLTALTDPEGDVRYAAARALAGAAATEPEVVKALLQALTDPEGDVRYAAASALEGAAATEPEVVKALLQALTDPEWDVQSAAARALEGAAATEPEVVKALLQALTDPEGAVRYAAARALAGAAATEPEVVKALLQALTDPEWAVRSAAARALAGAAATEPEVVKALLQALTDPEGDVRSAAARALAGAAATEPEVVKVLLQALTDPEGDVRSAAARALAGAAATEPEVVKALLQALTDPEGAVRYAAASALEGAAATEPEVVKALLQALTDPEWDVQSAAARALEGAAATEPEVVKALLQALTDPEGAVQSAAARALAGAAATEPEVVKALLQALTDPEWDVQSAAARALAGAAATEPEVVKALLQALTDPEWDVRSAAARALAGAAATEPEVVKVLLQALTDPEGDVRSAAARALAGAAATEPEVVKALLQALTDPEWDVRSAAASALEGAAATEPEVVKALLQALTDPEGAVRSAAARALEGAAATEPEVVKALLQALTDPEWDVRSAAARALAGAAATEPEVVKVLLQALTDPEWDVRSAAARALQNLNWQTVDDHLLVPSVNQLYGLLYNPVARDGALQLLRTVFEGRPLPNYKWVSRRKRQERRDKLLAGVFWPLLILSCFIVAYGLTSFPSDSRLPQTNTIASGLIGIFASLSQLIGKPLPNPFRREKS